MQGVTEKPNTRAECISQGWQCACRPKVHAGQMHAQRCVRCEEKHRLCKECICAVRASRVGIPVQG